MAGGGSTYDIKSELKVSFDLDDMIASIFKEELVNVGYKEILVESLADTDQLMTDVMTKVPVVQEMFDVMESDVSRVETEMKIFERELLKFMSPDVIDLDEETEELDRNVILKDTSSKLTKPPIKAFPSTPKLNKVHVHQHQAVQTQAIQTQVTPPQAIQPHQTQDTPPQKKPVNGILGPEYLSVGLQVLAFCKDEWKQAVIIDILQHRGKTKYKVRFGSKRKSLLQINYLACINTSSMFDTGQIPVGSRVAADYKDEGIYSGVVAESSDRKVNKNRFLIFFDDGYAMYCKPWHLYLVYGPQTRVWNYISHKATADYIKDYLSTPQRPILIVKEGQSLKVEFDGEWHKARCVRIDCNLVEVLYLSDSSREWIYRGSMRLEPLYRQHHGPAVKSDKQATPNRIARAHTGVRTSHIEYIDLTRDTSPTDENRTRSFQSKDKKQDKFQSSIPQTDKSVVEEKRSNTKNKEGGWEAPWIRSRDERQKDQRTPPTRLPISYTEMRGDVDVASRLERTLNQMEGRGEEGKMEGRASDTVRAPGRIHAVRKTSNDMQRGSPVVDDTVPDDCIEPDICVQSVQRRLTRQSSLSESHQCTVHCILPSKVKWSQLHGINPLRKPLLMGWSREMERIKTLTVRKSYAVFYITPCGKTCRNMADVERYMIECNETDLDYDNFCFNHKVRTNVDAEPRPEDIKYFASDYSKGKEDLPISCVNEINTEPPPKMPYSKYRVQGKGVKINTSPDYMVCCDCPDNCRDRSKCPCQQLTVQATSCCRGSKVKTEAGYKYKRLYSFLSTGIYECNPKCKCNSQCKNRVVQKGLQCRLQLFKTQKKGWGIRCLDDIANGAFVCIYTGKIQTEANANSEGLLFGDEYLAELDHIEVAENEKSGFNNDASSGFNSGSDQNPYSSDDEFYTNKENKERETSPNNNNESAYPEHENEDCVKLTLKRNNSSNWQVSPDSEPPDQLVDKKSLKLDIKSVLQGSKKKYGYVITDPGSPSSLPEDVRKRRSRSMVPRGKVSPGSSSDSENGAKDSNAAVHDEDTTDTDSDNPDVLNASNRSVPTARKSTGGSKTSKSSQNVSNPTEEDDSDQEEITSVNRTRRYFGSDSMFIIDAKQTGNLGRFLNHSCSPNLMVQNVFIDTQDLRFPWVAFFASSAIRAGTELTWDYNYEIGSVDGRVIHCYCGSTKCRKRLL